MPVTEETPTRPNNPYGWSKWMAEQAITDFAKANPEFKVYPQPVVQ
jgi:UDP-glucose 4-epimerase